MEQEQWKDIQGFEGVYQISNNGDLKSLDRYVDGKLGSKRFQPGKIQNPEVTKKGYLRYTLSISRERSIRKLAHVLVAEYFLTKESEKTQVNHKNGIKGDNSIENLEWCTAKENARHAWDNGLNKPNYRMRGRTDASAPSSKKVNVSDKEGNIIAQCVSIKEASKKFNTPVGVISRCLNGHVKKPRGYNFSLAA